MLERPHDMFLHRAFGDPQACRNDGIGAVMDTMEEKHFSTACRKCIQRLAEQGDTLTIEHGGFGRWLRTGKIQGLFQRLDGGVARLHLTQVIERQVSRRAKQERSRMGDHLFAG